MKRFRKTQAALDLPTLKLEGGLFLPDQLEKAAHGRADGQTELDYGCPKGVKLKDEIGRAFQIACAQWRDFAGRRERKDLDAGKLTTAFVTELLRDAFGYTDLTAIGPLTVGDRQYPRTLEAGSLPVLVAPHTLSLDDPDTRFAVTGGGSRRKTAFQSLQELLNASDAHLWAITSNGLSLRLLRDAATLTRPSFLEVDLADLLGGSRYAEFTNVWRLLHASRAPKSGSPATACHWEHWREAGKEEGTRVRDGLREGVTRALLTLGTGFIKHPANDALRLALDVGTLTKDAYFQQLLRLIYRLIFLFSVEERGLLHPQDDSKAAIAARRAYAEGYALGRLRALSLKRRARNRFDDHWQAVQIVFRGLANGQPRLALPALGGLFAESQCPALDAARLDNTHWLSVMQALRWFATARSGGLAPVDYRNMGPEELGSVYESLLELVPSIDLPARRFGFVGLTEDGSTAGNARKLSGSYYTPDSLVQALIKSALDPVIEQRLKDHPDRPIDALLDLRVIDPSCGSGHFLLAAGRRIAEKLAQLRSVEAGHDGAVRPQDYRHALREVVSRCLFGVDRNPMAIELARTALWLEGYEEGRPLGFLDHHLQVGDALLGVTDLKVLEFGIAKDAYKPLSGDDKAACKELGKLNAAALRDLAKKRSQHAFGQLDVIHQPDSGLERLKALEAMTDATTAEIDAKARAYSDYLHGARTSRLAQAADALLGAYLLPKPADANPAGILGLPPIAIPTSANLYLSMSGEPLPADQRAALTAAQAACREARVLHWPLAFPQVFANGGFDCVLGNPPWERIKLQEEEFFATRHQEVAEAKNKAERSQRIQWLSEGMLARHLHPDLSQAPQEAEAEKRLYAEFISARRIAEAASLFAHVDGEDGGRYPLTGVGDVNTYALFAETISQITRQQGRAGFIVPTGIATDDSTKAYFASLTQGCRLVSLESFENEELIFPSVHHAFRFCLLTLGKSNDAEFVFCARQVAQIHADHRRFRLTPEEFRLVNPNTLTCPVFRSARDAALSKKLYRSAPVLIDETRADGNPWGIRFMTMLHMSSDSYLFVNQPGQGLLPLYEAKMIHLFDHRAGSYEGRNDERGFRVLPNPSIEQYQDQNYRPTPFYWVESKEVSKRMPSNEVPSWLLVFKDVTATSNERTVISTIIPSAAVGHTAPQILSSRSAQEIALLLANINSLVLDYCARQKVGGLHLTFSYFRQFPMIPPKRYIDTDHAFIVPRVLELIYTAHDLAGWAKDLGYEGPPFRFDPERRAVLRAELDAYYARLYGLDRDELRYILDPADVMGADYPSETFRVLKHNDERNFGEYRTRRLVLEAWDRQNDH